MRNVIPFQSHHQPKSSAPAAKKGFSTLDQVAATALKIAEQQARAVEMMKQTVESLERFHGTTKSLIEYSDDHDAAGRLASDARTIEQMLEQLRTRLDRLSQH
jgi:hypothetical protein